MLIVWLLALGFVGRAIWRRRSELISARGVGVGADVGHLQDLPRARVEEMTMVGPAVARLVLASANSDGANAPDPELDGGVFLVSMSVKDPGFAILQEWLERRSVLGLVMPPDTKLIRLRCLDDLQPLTLRRVDN